MSISDREIRHSTCVSVDGVGILIVGPSGSGKSTLAIKLIALGAFLVGDDRCLLIGDGRGITVEQRIDTALKSQLLVKRREEQEKVGVDLLQQPS